MTSKPTGIGVHLGFYKATLLPHFDEPGKIQSLTFRLADSLSKEKAYELRNGVPGDDIQRLFSLLDDELDRCAGNCWLRNPEIASLVQDALLYFDDKRYKLLCWVVMPNHVHCIIQQFEGFPLGQVVKSWKSHTAVRANRLLGRQGPFWERNYFDRYVRNRGHLALAADYIHYNPVAAGLCSRMEDWPWSSYHRYVDQVKS